MAGPPTPWLPRYPRAAGADKAAPQPPHCPNGGLDTAAHRFPHAIPEALRPGPDRALNPSAQPPDAHPLDVQRRHYAQYRHQSVRTRCHADPPRQAAPVRRLSPGCHGSGRNHLSPHPSQADRTPLLPRLPPPLPSGPSTYSAQCRPVGYLGAEFCPRPGDLPDGADPDPRVPDPGHTAVRAASVTEATLTHDVRRRPTLPRGPPRSTIGAEELNFRVRNGTGCFPFAMTAETLWRFRSSAFPGGLPVTRPTAPREPHSGRERTAWESPPRQRMYEPSLSAY